MRYLICPYICDNKTEYGYCKTTACINPENNNRVITSNRTLTEEEIKSLVNENKEKGGAE